MRSRITATKGPQERQFPFTAQNEPVQFRFEPGGLSGDDLFGAAEEEDQMSETSIPETPLLNMSLKPTPDPVFIPHVIVGPDGKARDGWEMWVGDACFGRADSKDLLLASYARLQSPPDASHWRTVFGRRGARPQARKHGAEFESWEAVRHAEAE